MKNFVSLVLVAAAFVLVGCNSGPQRTATYHKDGSGNILSGTETIVEKVNGEKVTTTNLLGPNGQVLSTTQTVVPDETKGEMFGIYKGPSQYSSRPVYYGRYGNHPYGCGCSSCCKKPGRVFNK